MTTQPHRISYLPPALEARLGGQHADAAMRPVIRRLAGHALCRIISSLTIGEALEHLFGREASADVLRAAVEPASTDSASALAGVGVADFMRYLGGRSAAATLFARSTRVDMAGISTVALPGWVGDFAAPTWIEEGEPIAVAQAAAEAAELGPVRKLALIVALTDELNQATGGTAELIIGAALRDGTAKALDATLFSDDDATDAQPRGLLHDVTPITAATGGGADAASKDVGALYGALATAGGGSNVILIASPPQAAVLRIVAPGLETIATAALPSGTILALEQDALVSGFDGTARVEVTKQATLHFDDANPAPISTAGDPNTIAAPVRSLYQQNLLGLRVVMKAAWAVRAPNLVQVITGTSW